MSSAQATLSLPSRAPEPGPSAVGRFAAGGTPAASGAGQLATSPLVAPPPPPAAGMWAPRAGLDTPAAAAAAPSAAAPVRDNPFNTVRYKLTASLD